MNKETLATAIVICLTQGLSAAYRPIPFTDATASWGLSKPLTGIMAHAAACGDIDNDGDLDLYVGNFCDRPPEKYIGATGPVPNMLLVNDGGTFRKSSEPKLAFEARTSGAVFVDLDNDGDLDLYVSNNSKAKGLRVPNKLFENVGGRFRDISEGNSACIVMGGRSVGILDYDADGLLDMLVAEDKWTGRRTRLFRNKGKLEFEDVSQKAGLPDDLPGLGVVTPDLNEDGWPDIFVSQANRLFLSKGDATYRPADSKVFQYAPLNNEDSPCGVAFGDLNRDARMDIVIVDHGQPARQHLFLNLGLADGTPQFKEVTRQAGLDYRFPSWTPEKLHLKHAHVEIADFDNDSWQDIFVAATYRRGSETQPFICRNVTASVTRASSDGVRVPRFEVPPIEKADAYFSAGPVADYDRDGRPDIFLVSWFPQIPSKLFLNRNKPNPVRNSGKGRHPTNRKISNGANHWLGVKVVGSTINRMGIGVKVRVYPAGKLGQAKELIGYQEIGTGFGYCSAAEAVAHFGLGDLTSCDVEVVLPYGKGTIGKRRVKAGRLLVVREPSR